MTSRHRRRRAGAGRVAVRGFDFDRARMRHCWVCRGKISVPALAPNCGVMLADEGLVSFALWHPACVSAVPERVRELAALQSVQAHRGPKVSLLECPTWGVFGGGAAAV